MRRLTLVTVAVCGVVVFSGCFYAAKYEAAYLNPQSRQALFETFRSGNAAMDCGLACSGRWGNTRFKVKKLHDSEQWEQLAWEVLYIGYYNDLAWYYLARAAEGLGYFDAARIYYKKSIAIALGQAPGVAPCNYLFNYCDGFAFPAVSEMRLANLGTVTVQEHTERERPSAAAAAGPLPQLPPQDTRREETKSIASLSPEGVWWMMNARWGLIAIEEDQEMRQAAIYTSLPWLDNPEDLQVMIDNARSTPELYASPTTIWTAENVLPAWAASTLVANQYMEAGPQNWSLTLITPHRRGFPPLLSGPCRILL